jgi:ribokinase
MLAYACVGGLRIDYVISPDGRAASGVFGGNAAYAAAGARLWTSPGQLGIIAKSGTTFPRRWLEELESHGIQTGCIVHLPLAVEQRTFFAHLPDGTRDESDPERHYRALGLPLPAGLVGYVQPSSNQDEIAYRPLRIKSEDIRPECWPRRALHFSPTDWETMIACVPAAHAAGVPQITADPGLWMKLHRPEEIYPLIRMCHAFLPSEMEARWMLGQSRTPQEITLALAEEGPPIVVLKMGDRGSLVWDGRRKRMSRVPAFPTQIIDVTGAGDAFCGGFAVGLNQTDDPVIAACYGAVSASFTIEGFGALHALTCDPEEAQRRLAWIQQGVEQV